MKCPECDGTGRKEFEAGLIELPCETCEGTGDVPGWKFEELMKRKAEEDVLTAETMRKAKDITSSAPMSQEDLEAVQKDSYIPLLKGQYFCTKCGICHYEKSKIGRRHLKHRQEEQIGEALDDNPSDSGAGPAGQPTRGPDTGEPEQSKEPTVSE